MKKRPGVYGFMDADGTSTWGPHRRRAVFGFVCLGLWVAFKAGIGLADGWGEAFPDNRSVIVSLAVILGVGLPTWISWSAHRQFGSSRLIPDRTPSPGETLGAVLETGERLAHAREVRFDLVEMHRSTAADFVPEDWTFGKHVRATTSVSVGAYEVAPGSTRIRVSLPVPADGWASFRSSGLGFSFLDAPLFLGSRVTEHAWEVRASAEVEGARYRARFRVNVAPIASIPSSST